MFIKNITIVTNRGDTIQMENVSEAFVLTLFQKCNETSLLMNNSEVIKETVVDTITVPVSKEKEKTYYEKRKKDPKFIEESRLRAAARYHAKKNDPEFRAAAKLASKKHYEKIKEERSKEKEEKKKKNIIVA